MLAREFDTDGGALSGPFPEWLVSGGCNPNVEELDLSYNRVRCGGGGGGVRRTGKAGSVGGERGVLQLYNLMSTMCYHA